MRKPTTESRGVGRPKTADPRVSRRVGLNRSEEERIERALAMRGLDFSTVARALLLACAGRIEKGEPTGI